MPEGPQGARPATPLEIAEWERYKQYYNNVLAPAVLKCKVVSEIANQAQIFLDKRKLPGFVYDAKSLNDTISLLNRFNMFGRYITGVESGKYGIRITNGDIDILAPPNMKPEEYEPDLYPSLGVAPIIWVLGVGAVLVGGILGVASILKFDAEKQRETNTGRLIDAEKVMATASPDVRRAWMDFKRLMIPQAKTAGVLEKLLGTEATGKIGAGLGLGLLLLLGVFAFGQRRM